MTIPNAEHLFEQAERLTLPSGRGAARQVDLRRAASSAYYGLFHAVMAAAADEFVGRSKRASMEYGLIYRSIDHRSLRELCAEVAKPVRSARYRRYEPEGGFGPELKAFAVALGELQRGRYEADYDPTIRLKRSDALAAVLTARSACQRLRDTSPEVRRIFLALLLFPPR